MRRPRSSRLTHRGKCTYTTESDTNPAIVQAPPTP